jgi:AmiR/NasT family two-component response regulator
VKVLIAEDEPLVARDLASLVQGLGHQVVATVDTGRRAVEGARTLNPELLLLDVALPGLDGVGVAREILAFRPMPIIMVTAHADPELVERAAAAGVMNYLLKPVSQAALRAGIQVACARFAELQALAEQVRGLTEALEVRKLVEQAKGIRMKRLRLGEAEAFRRLQRRAAAERRSLREVAQAVREADRFFGELETQEN